jgi:basic amino acid/polyamine antiporter, APA family
MSDNHSAPTLKRELGLFTSTLLVAGLVIGSGVFKKIGPMANTGLGEGAILAAWAVAGIVTFFGALSAGGLSTMTDQSGGTYEYFRLSFGQTFAFISGWSDFMVVGTGVNAALAYFFAQAVNSMIPLPNPLDAMAHISLFGFIHPFDQSGIKIVAIITMVILTAINCIGTKESGVFNNIVTSAKIIGILIVVVIGLAWPVSHNANSVATVSNTGSVSFMSGFFTALLAALWAYDGWIYVTNVAGEVKDSRKKMPLALAFGILITIVVFLVVDYVYMRNLPLSELRAVPEDGIAALAVAEHMFGQVGKTLLGVLVIVAVFGALNSNLVSIPRKYYQMAHEGYFFSNAKKISPRFRTPIVAMIYSLVWSSVLVLSGTFDMLTDMVVFTAFIFYGSLCVALIKMKRNGAITGKIAGYPYAPVLFLLFSAVFLTHTLITEPKKSLFGLILILSSVPFYFVFRSLKGRRGLNF